MRGSGFVQIFKDFSNWSTVAAVPHVANATNKISRIFWIVVFVFVLGMFFYELYILISKYFAYPATVQTEMIFEQQIFPVVTICNMNPYKYSVVKSNNAFSSIRSLMTTYGSAVGGSTTSDKWGLYVDQAESYNLDSRAADALLLESALLSDDVKAPALYTYSDLVQDCTFAGSPCFESDFTRFVDPVYGACYSFNEDKSLNFSVSRQGIQFGLKLKLAVTQTLTDGTTDFLPTTRLAGARISIASRGQLSGLDSNGIDAGVGYMSAISISLTKNRRAKKPYGKCVDRESDSTDYYKNHTYSLETCFEGCKQRDTVSKCSCASPRYALGASDAFCQPTKENLDCFQSLKGNQTNTENPNIDLLSDCACSPPCEESTFTPTVSLARFPSDSYYVATSSLTGSQSCSTSNFKFSNQKECQKWYQKNALIVQVFFESLSYEMYTETAGYTISNVVNDLGGQAGLWLGLSVISCAEMAGLVLLMCGFCVTGGGIRISPNLDDYDNDPRIRDVEDVKKELDHMEKDHKQRGNFDEDDKGFGDDDEDVDGDIFEKDDESIKKKN